MLGVGTPDVSWGLSCAGVWAGGAAVGLDTVTLAGGVGVSAEVPEIAGVVPWTARPEITEVQPAASTGEISRATASSIGRILPVPAICTAPALPRAQETPRPDAASLLRWR